jgi:hypothetical protein
MKRRSRAQCSFRGRHDAALMLLAHHSIADGMSLAFAMRDKLQAIAGSPLSEPTLPSSQDEILENLPVRNGMSGSDGRPVPVGPASNIRERDNARPNVQGLCFFGSFHHEA